jgi:glycosyltransferase involved in cell wall biosynthesis
MCSAHPSLPAGRGRWMALGRQAMEARDWAAAVQAYGQGLVEQPPLATHYAANLERARAQWWAEHGRPGADGALLPVVVAAAELSHNASGRAYTLAKLYGHLGHPVQLLGSHFPQWGREIWEPLRGAALPMHTCVVEQEPRFVRQAWNLVLQHPSALVHLSKPRLPALVFGLLYKLAWGAAVLVDIDDEELLFVGEHEPLSPQELLGQGEGWPGPHQLMGALWTRLAVHLAQAFDGVTVANQPLQQRYGGTLIPHGRDPAELQPATADRKRAARQRFGIPSQAGVVLFFGTPRRHKGVLEVAAALADLPDSLQPLLVVAGAFAPEDQALERELQGLLPEGRLRLLGNQPLHQAAEVLAMADLVVLLSSGEVAAYQSPAKLSDALAMALPVLVRAVAPLQQALACGWVLPAPEHPGQLRDRIAALLASPQLREAQSARALAGFAEAYALPAVAPDLAAAAATALRAPTPAHPQLRELLHHLQPVMAELR